MTHVLEGPAKPGRKKMTSRTEDVAGSSASTPTQEMEPPFNGVTIFINCSTGRLQRKACTDTGADGNFVDSKVVKSAGLETYSIEGELNYQLGDGSKLTPIAWLNMEFTVGGRPYKTYTERFLVVEEAPYDALLGAAFCKNIYARDPQLWTHILQRSKASIAKSEEMRAERDAMDQEDVGNERIHLQNNNNRERERLASVPSEGLVDTITENQPAQGIYTQSQGQIDLRANDRQGYAGSSGATQGSLEANGRLRDI
ncbi:hypothetical protein GP486_001532 [Trichoglossum hirsutum]|uniref:Uncharacterized protein n=1 Tax=Trichoglossum hirsutum TaxID=265104 RepID=A0A9P8LFX7_9PEZI|nr:hypothetical protein GP486_001532 [Trichoglossum hirsutum]